MTMVMQEPGLNFGPSVTVSDPDFFLEESQQGFNGLHRPSYSAVSTAPPSYASSVDGQTAKWWDVEAERILRGSNLQAIQLLCRFRPYADESLPRTIPSKRWTPRLNTFLLHLGFEEGCQTIVDPDVDQKVEEILKRLTPSPSLDSRGPWAAQKAIHEPDASRLASELNEASFMEFKRISYPDLVRRSLYPDEYVDTIEDCIDWHNGLLQQILGHLKTFPDEVGKYDRIERVSSIRMISWVQFTNSIGRNCTRKALCIGPCPRVYTWSALTAYLQMPCHNPTLSLFSVLLELFPARTPSNYWNSTLYWRCAFDDHTHTLRISTGRSTSKQTSIYSTASLRCPLKT